jgi:glycosyltransferase involved in cell wall biosynthesis
MRILQIVADGRPGGGTSVVLDLARSLRTRHGHDVVLASEPDSHALAMASEERIEAHGIDLWRGRLERSGPGAIRSLLAEAQPDLVHAHGGRAGLAVARALRRHSTLPFIYTVHGYHFLAKPWPQRIAGAMAEWWAGRCAHAVTWVCMADRRLAGSWQLDPGRPGDQVILNGLDLASLPAAGQDGMMLVAFLGRLVPQKNPRLAVDLLSRPELEDARLVMIGGGPLEDEIWQRAREAGTDGRLRITGALPRDQALAELARAAVMVLPSLWEGIPVALAEAMAMGIPVVASGVRGVPELVEDGMSGLLRDDPHDLAGFAQDVRRVLHDRPFAEKLAQHARKTVEQRCSLPRMVQRTLPANMQPRHACPVVVRVLL